MIKHLIFQRVHFDCLRSETFNRKDDVLEKNRLLSVIMPDGSRKMLVGDGVTKVTELPLLSQVTLDPNVTYFTGEPYHRCEFLTKPLTGE